MTATLRELRERGYMRRSEGPGAVLTPTLDAGGERWTLDGRPVHGGDTLDLLVWAEREPCPSCDGEGRGRPQVRCADCDGEGELYRCDWVRFRFEYRNAGDGSGYALLYLRLWNGAGAEHLAVRVEAGDLVRCRWPVAP